MPSVEEEIRSDVARERLQPEDDLQRRLVVGLRRGLAVGEKT